MSDADPIPQSKNREDPPVVYRDEFEDPLDIGWTATKLALDEPVYGAKRVVDLFTLMAITLAFALLFAAMKAMSVPPIEFFAVTSYVTFVAISQMLLFGGNSPRLASLVGGPIAWALTFACISIWDGHWDTVEIVCTLPMGVPAGYFAGCLIAGVFLVADQLRKGHTQINEIATRNFFEDDFKK